MHGNGTVLDMSWWKQCSKVSELWHKVGFTFREGSLGEDTSDEMVESESGQEEKKATTSTRYS